MVGQPAPVRGRKRYSVCLIREEAASIPLQMDSDLCLCPFLAVHPWGSYLTSVSPSFSIYKLDISYSYRENKMSASEAQ